MVTHNKINKEYGARSKRDTEVCEYNFQGQVKEIGSGYARARVKGIVELLEKEKLGFTKDDLSLHSIRSGGAMAMFFIRNIKDQNTESREMGK